MYTLFLDETNTQPSEKSKFFIYGGVFFSAGKTLDLHLGMENIRKTYGYLKGEEFKFDTQSKPKRISVASFREAKNEVLDLCVKNDVRFIAYLVHHGVAMQKSLEIKITWASNEIIDVFDTFLSLKKDVGQCLFDKLPFNNEKRFLASLFQNGITTALFKDVPRPTKNILMFGMSPVGASNISSMADIILGAFRYCVNYPAESEPFKAMMPKINELFHSYSVTTTGKRIIWDHGVLVRPYRSIAYETANEQLMKKLNIQ